MKLESGSHALGAYGEWKFRRGNTVDSGNEIVKMRGTGSDGEDFFVVNDDGGNQNFRFEGDTDPYLLNGIASTDNLGVGKSSPTSKLHLGGSLAVPITSVSATTTLNGTHYTVKVDASGGARTINLPAASGCSDRVYTIKKIDSSGNAVTVDGNASETIDGATTYSLATQWKYVMIQSDGTNWMVIANN